MTTEYTHSHRITVTVQGRYMHGREHEHATVTIAGNGSLQHAVDTFRAALLAMGFAADTAGRLTIGED